MTYLSPKKKELIRRMQVAQNQTTRTLKDVQLEYSRLCTQAGDLQYKVLCFQGDLQKINQRMFELQQESTTFSKDENGRAQDSQNTDSTETTHATESDTGETSVSASVS